MSWVRASGAVVVLLLMRGSASGQSMPELPLQTYQEVAGQAVAAVLMLLVAPATQADPRQTSEAIAARAAEGAAAMSAGRFEDAASIYQEVSSARPGDAGLLLNLGMARYMGGHPADALAPLQKALRLQPGLAPASLFLGATLLDLGRLTEAVPPLVRAVTAMPQNAEARELLGRAYLERSQFTKSAQHYRVLTALQPVNPKGWHGLARSYEGLAEQALSALQQQSPNSPLLDLVVADIAVTQEKYAAALVIYRRVLDGTPPVGGLHEAVAELYERAGKPEWAAAELQKVRRRSAAECATHAAECAFLAGKVQESLAAALQSTAPTAKYWTIRAANRLATDAVARLETLPSSVELHLIRAELAQSRGRHPEAVTEIRAALALSPGSPVIETALAEALLQAHNLDEALPLLERLTRESSDDVSLQITYGEALIASQQVDRAIPILERAVAADGTLLAGRAALGRAYVQTARYAEALPHLRAAAAEDQDGDLHYQLARAYQALDRPVEAKNAMAEFQKRRQRAASRATNSAPDAVLTPPK